jgi:2'-hydroxyisoflavone reductase
MRRREFLRAAAAAGAFPFQSVGRSSPPVQQVAPLRLLVLGGTGFIGPHQVRYAVQRGHRVTVFNRGRSAARLPAEVEHLTGDRNGDLESLRGRSWDAVVDNPTTLPVWVRDIGALLHERAEHYVFISTISVYADTLRPGMDESAPLARYEGADPMAETIESFSRNLGALYGPLKALSEREAERWFPGRTTVIRPGLIVGPGDPSDRFTYWPVRISRGGEVLAPGTPLDPVQVIDARDLAEWTIRMVERRAFGTYNATSQPREIGSVLEGMMPLAERPARLTFVDQDFLREQGVQPWSDMPIWVPPSGDSAGFSRLSVARALEQGLTFRPVPATAADTLSWFRTLPSERQAQLRAGVTAEREAEVLREWHARERA